MYAAIVLSSIYRREGSKFNFQLVLNTMQRKVYFTSVILAVLRMAFFVVAIFSWDAENGMVENDKLLFYSLDEYSNVLFFTLSSILSLFWAEIYFICVDDAVSFKYVLRPVVYLLNIAAYLGVAICSVLLIYVYTDETDYMFAEYSVQVGVMYTISAIIFARFAYKTSIEFNMIPVHVSTRKERNKALKRITFIFISALLLRAIIIMILTNKVITISSWEWSFVVAYYLILEYCPIVMALVFYRSVDRFEEDGTDTNSRPWETIPLNIDASTDSSKQEDMLVERLSFS